MSSYQKLLGEISSLSLEDKEALVEDLQEMIDIELEALPYVPDHHDHLRSTESRALMDE